MAVSGNLSQHSFTDLLKVLNSQSGSLFLHSAYQGRTLELALAQGRLQAMYMDGFQIQDRHQVQTIMGQLSELTSGTFEFEAKASPPPSSGVLNLELGKLVGQISANATIQEDLLPPPDMQFVAVEKVDEQGLPPAVAATWRRLYPRLLGGLGVSARDLTASTGLSERDLQVALYRLRSLGLIVPLTEAPRSQLANFTSPAASPVIRLLSGAFGRRQKK